jgi:hypothetical protein
VKHQAKTSLYDHDGISYRMLTMKVEIYSKIAK